jgi:hypothetical protein
MEVCALKPVVGSSKAVFKASSAEVDRVTYGSDLAIVTRKVQ